MKAKIYDFHTDIFLQKEEVDTLCKPGCGADTCIWLAVGPNGFECLSKNRPPLLVARWSNGETNAKRNGCIEVHNWNPADEVEKYYPGVEVEISVKKIK